MYNSCVPEVQYLSIDLFGYTLKAMQIYSLEGAGVAARRWILAELSHFILSQFPLIHRYLSIFLRLSSTLQMFVFSYSG